MLHVACCVAVAVAVSIAVAVLVLVEIDVILVKLRLFSEYVGHFASQTTVKAREIEKRFL
jgi:hypothetical protein